MSRDGRAELAKLFMKHGCKANHVDSYGQTPIFYAARDGYVELMKILVAGGCDADHVDNEGQSPIFYAIINSQMDCVNYLMKECDVNVVREDNKSQNLIHYASKYKLFPLIETLMERGVVCPGDVKRKLARTQSKGIQRTKSAAVPASEVEVNEPDAPVEEEAPVEYNPEEPLDITPK